jgi:oligopeptide transport system ATP-binding protein
MSSPPLIDVEDLRVHFINGRRCLKAIDGISFSLKESETLGLVGESGCGKSTTGKAVLHLEQPTGGKILFRGADLSQMSSKELGAFRRESQIIFQDPYASLNPRMTAGDIIAEPLDIHKLEKGTARQARIYELLQLVGLSPHQASRFPHEFSGGQRQRIGIARALAVRPHFIVCDEPISALDVSVQAQIINLLKTLQEEMGIAYLFITHDLRVVKYLSKNIAVMYLGHIVEYAPSEELYKTPCHPYTQALLAAIPLPDPIQERRRTRIVLKEEVPSAYDPPSGCVFSTRCPHAQAICHLERPAMRQMAPHHFAACHFAPELVNQAGQ